MIKRLFLISIIIFMLPVLVACNGSKIVDQDYDVVTLYKLNNNKMEKISELNDKEKIKKLTDLINEGNRKDAKALNFEKGPDGILEFDKKGEKLELNIFTDTGNILNDDYYVDCNINLTKYFKY